MFNPEETVEDFKRAKKQISDKIVTCAKRVEEKEIPLQDLTFNVMISKAPSEYVKTIPQHIRAAKLLESIREVKKGDKISYVKILNKPGVKPVEMAKKEEIDSKNKSHHQWIWILTQCLGNQNKLD